MFKKEYFLAGGTLLWILLALFGLYQSLKPSQIVTQEPQQLEILTATKDLSAGDLIRHADLNWVAVPDKVLAPDLITKNNQSAIEYIGREVIIPILANQPIKEAYLDHSHKPGKMAALVSHGRYAINIPLTPADNGFSQFLTPGDKIDIILTRSFTEKEHAEPTTISQVILSHIMVLSVGNQTIDAEKSSPSSSTTTAPPTPTSLIESMNIEVSIQQAEKLSAAKEMGKLSFLIRAPQHQMLIHPRDARLPLFSSKHLNQNYSNASIEFHGSSVTTHPGDS